MVIDLDAAAVVAHDAGLVEPETVRIRNTAHGHEHDVGLDGLGAPPAAGSTVSVTLSLAFLAPVTLEASLKLKPCFCRMRWKFFATSRPCRAGCGRDIR
jgi:hypothetical protein